MLSKGCLMVVLFVLAGRLGRAGLLTFSYVASGGVLAGSFEGNLQPDNNTFLITSVLPAPTFNGVQGVPLTFVDSFDHWLFHVPAVATVTLDGSYLDVIACENMACADELVFAFGYLPTGPISAMHSPYGQLPFQGFDPANWTASVTVAAVPEPQSILLLLTAVGMIGGCWMATRKRLATAPKNSVSS